MAVKLSVGLQKKVGLPDFGSLGASCHVEFEIDRGLLEHNLDGFHRKVSEAFVACRQAVQDQLAAASCPHGEDSSGELASSHNHSDASRHDVEPRPSRSVPPTPNRTNGHAGNNGHAGPTGHAGHNGHAGTSGYASRPDIGTVTQSQLRAIHAISRRSRMDPAVLVRERFQLDRPESLSIRQASSLIDELKRGIPEVRT